MYLAMWMLRLKSDYKSFRFGTTSRPWTRRPKNCSSILGEERFVSVLEIVETDHEACSAVGRAVLPHHESDHSPLSSHTVKI